MTTRARTPQRKKQFLEALSQTAVVSRACKAANLPRPTAYDWRASDPVFAAAWDTALDNALDEVEYVAWQLALSGDHPSSTHWVLSRRRPEVWGDKEKIEVTGADGGPVEVAQTVHLPDAATWAEILRIREERERDSQE